MNLKGSMKGQLSFINFIALFVVQFMYFAILPVVTSISNTTIVGLQMGPQNEFTTWLIVLIEILPFAIELMIILTGFWIAMPRQQGG